MKIERSKLRQRLLRNGFDLSTPILGLGSREQSGQRLALWHFCVATLKL